MDGGVLKIASETAYDALENARDVVVRLCAKPRTLAEVAEARGTTDIARLQKDLDRLVRNGLLRKVGEHYEGVAPVVHAPRQEGMVTFVTRVVLPNLMHMLQDGQAFAMLLDLNIPVDDQRRLRPDLVQALARDLNSISDEPTTEEKDAYTLVAMGTSDVAPPGELGERLIEMVRRTSRQRLIPSDADRAFYTQFDTSLAPSSIDRALARVRQAPAELERLHPESSKPNYSVAFGFSKRSTDGGVR